MTKRTDPDEKKTVLERLLRWFQNHRLFAVLIFAGIAIAGIWKVSEAVVGLTRLIAPPKNAPMRVLQETVEVGPPYTVLQRVRDGSVPPELRALQSAKAFFSEPVSGIDRTDLRLDGQDEDTEIWLEAVYNAGGALQPTANLRILSDGKVVVDRQAAAGKDAVTVVAAAKLRLHRKRPADFAATGSGPNTWPKNITLKAYRVTSQKTRK